MLDNECLGSANGIDFMAVPTVEDLLNQEIVS